jgi:hypothetical protein
MKVDKNVETVTEMKPVEVKKTVGYTLELTPEEATVLFDIVSKMPVCHCGAPEELSTLVYNIYEELKKAGVRLGPQNTICKFGTITFTNGKTSENWQG